jgi:hypothetical protein
MTVYDHKMIRHPRSMATFDPSKRAMVYADMNDYSFVWDPADEASYREHYELEKDGAVNWDGLLLSGWCMLDEWDREWRSTIVTSPLDPRAAPLAWVEPIGSGYAITEFGPWSEQNEEWFREITERRLPSLRPNSWRLERLDGNRVLSWHFDEPLNGTDHLWLVLFLDREVEVRGRVRRPFAKEDVRTERGPRVTEGNEAAA